MLRRSALFSVIGMGILCSLTFGQSVTITSEAVANPPGGGMYLWYEIRVDPEDATNMILCGSHWDAKDNALYGFVYSSVDGGKTWQSALEDRSSKWVSEQSCAFGVHGVAYFVSDASEIDRDGMPRHERGTTRIFVTHDSGRTWKEAIRTGWTDHSSAVVDRAPGPNQNRLYVFFNSPDTFFRSIDHHTGSAALPRTGSSVGLISYRDGELKIDGPIFNSHMAAMNYHGAYPEDSFVLKDGSFLTFLSSQKAIASVHTNPDRDVLELPVTITSTPPDEGPCGYFLQSASAYDPLRDTLYLVYPEARDDKQCRLMVTTSVDDGKNWAKPEEMHSEDAFPERIYAKPTLAVNHEGVLAVMWRDAPLRSDCWVFATSNDGGKSLSPGRKLNNCSSPGKDVQAITHAYFWSVMFGPESNQEDRETDIYLRNLKNTVWVDRAIAATPDGTFHVVWSDAGDGHGEIRSAAVAVASAKQLAAPRVFGLTVVNNRIAILYGGTQHYDEKSGTLTLAVTFRNNSDSAIKAPFELEATTLSSGLFDIQITNSANQVTGGGAVWDVTSAVPGGVLIPGATSQPYLLIFHSAEKHYPIDPLGNVLSLSTKLYANP